MNDLRGNVRHSVSAWCFRRLYEAGPQGPASMTFEAFCRACAALGLESVELLVPNQWPAVQAAGLTCAMCRGPSSIDYGWNRLEHHNDLLGYFEPAIAAVARQGYPNIITFSGLRQGMSDEQGLEHCVQGLKRLMPIAEKHGVTVMVELLNSKVDHPDYMADHTAWGVELCRRVGSERLKLLYDIYHMQVMEGDIIRTVEAAAPYIGHYHTGGNPGRHEIDVAQEIHYPAVMRAIVATGYKGFVGQEFIPQREPLDSLQQAIAICDV
ncbi:MAG: TIM barrel protein [Lentisphaerae bacterium]|nr:TIM barrel protein [Lentisphaerota bacterium]